jgi:cell division cycle 20-like protein 1, cofactor of APC complex
MTADAQFENSIVVNMTSDSPQTPTLNTPPGSKTPPTIAGTRSMIENGESRPSLPRAGSEALDADLLARRLKDHDSAGRRQIQRTPGKSPSRKRQRIYGDRFIPNREGRDLHASYSLLHDDGSPATPSRSKKRAPHGELHFQRTEEANRTYSQVLRNELMGDSIPQAHHDFSTSIHDPSRAQTPPGVPSASTLPPASITPSTPHKNLFSYMSPQKRIGSGHPTPSRTPHSKYTGPINLNVNSDLYSVSPIHFTSQSILQHPRKPPRPISKVPYKVLDAPELADDFYLNLVDWGSSNILGVGLGSCVYMWNSTTGRVNKLCELQDNDLVTSVSWIQRGSHLAVGTHKGFVQIYDAEKSRRLRTMTGHTARVGALAWNEHILTSGSRDRIIYHRDVRSPEQHCKRLAGHKQEVCGLRWNGEDGQLASGGNDNKLLVWDKLSQTPLHRFSTHVAAVKAIAWSPHQHHLLASGGGTADRSIKFWNTATGSLIKEVDTGSQVCNLAWSKNSDEIVSTHGYSQNQIVVWKYPRMEQVVSLTGHTFRVLYLSASPDGTTVVTGAGDETLRFWKVFGKKNRGSGSDGEGMGMGIGGRLGDWGSIR